MQNKRPTPPPLLSSVLNLLSLASTYLVRHLTCQLNKTYAAPVPRAVFSLPTNT